MTEDRLGQFLLVLYQASRERPLHTFRQWALSELARRVPFDWACWRYGLLESDVCRIHGEVCYRQPDLPNALFEPAGDLPQPISIASPDQVLSLASANLTIAARDSAEDHHHLPYTELCLYRSDSRQPFSAQQRRDAEVLGAHLAEAWLIKLHLHIQSERRPLHPLGESALCDGRGTLWCKQPQFDSLLREEWPQWRGPCLPEELGAIIRSGSGAYEGKRVRCTASPGPSLDLTAIQVQRQPPLFSLPPRQRRIAIELAQGKTYNQIAHTLGISRSTVTNHANAIYSRLGISNKVQLALMCFGHTLQSIIV